MNLPEAKTIAAARSGGGGRSVDDVGDDSGCDAPATRVFKSGASSGRARGAQSLPADGDPASGLDLDWEG